MIVVKGFSFDRRLREAERALGPLKTILPLEVNEIITGGAARAFYLRAGLLHRTADLASSAIESYSQWRLMPAFLMTRAVLETVAAYYCLYQETEEGVASQDTGEAGRRVEAFVSGSNGHNYKDPQSADILAAVDRLEPVVRDVRADYDQFNRIALPSWGGLSNTIAPYILIGSASGSILRIVGWMWTGAPGYWRDFSTPLSRWTIRSSTSWGRAHARWTDQHRTRGLLMARPTEHLRRTEIGNRFGATFA